MLAPGRFVSNLLVDGDRATWWLERREGDGAPLHQAVRAALQAGPRRVEAEAQRMVDFAAAEATARDVRFENPV